MININNVMWNIVLTNDINYLKRNDGSVTLGITDKRKRTIYIYDSLNENAKRKVLIHELVHAWMFIYDYYLTVSEEEFVCEFVSNYAEDILFEVDNILSNIIFKKA